MEPHAGHALYKSKVKILYGHPIPDIISIKLKWYNGGLPGLLLIISTDIQVSLIRICYITWAGPLLDIEEQNSVLLLFSYIQNILQLYRCQHRRYL